MNELGLLKKVELRKAWMHEAADFTTWLAHQDNLALLADELGIEISLIETEASVGKFNVDILAEEPGTGQKIVIENQLESSNHDHLGKLITYASGYDAEIIIWIVKELREEHRQAIDWLNEHTDEKINIFAIKLELWQIGQSPYAPKFHVVSRPNDWAKAIKTKGKQGALSGTKMKQLQFWTDFNEFAQSKGTIFKLRKPSPQHWYQISYGSAASCISLTFNTMDNQMGCGISIHRDKDLFFKFKKYEISINKELGFTPEWMELPEIKVSRIKIFADADFEDTTRWPEYFDWFIKHAELFFKVFSKHLKNDR